CQQYDSHPRTF
nr:immunoglobulin light chain junction region [Macaca mulatta]